MRIRELTRSIDELIRDLEHLVRHAAPHLLGETGIGPITAAQLLGEIADVSRFATGRQARAHRRLRTDPSLIRTD
jgi:transposase